MAENIFMFDTPITDSAQESAVIRANFHALATNHATANPDVPDDPRNGMTRVLADDPNNIKYQLYWGSWRTIVEISGSTSQARRKSTNFSSSLQWIYAHNLSIYPLVQVIIGNEIVQPQKMEHASMDRVIITHGVALSGTVIVVG